MHSALCINKLITSVRQHPFDAFLIAFGYQAIDIQIAFTLAGLFRQDVTSVAVAAFEFARSCRAKTLGRAFVCF